MPVQGHRSFEGGLVLVYLRPDPVPGDFVVARGRGSDVRHSIPRWISRTCLMFSRSRHLDGEDEESRSPSPASAQRAGRPWA